MITKQTTLALITVGLLAASQPMFAENSLQNESTQTNEQQIQSPDISSNSNQSTSVDYSADIQAYVKETNSKKISYENGKTLFFADISNLAIGAFAGISLGLFGGSVASWTFDQKLPAAVFAAVGVATSAVTIWALTNNLSKTPYLVCDNEGLLCKGERKLQWHDVDQLIVVQYGNVRFDLYLVDKTKKVLFEITGDFKLLSLETLGHLGSIIEYYRNQALSLPKDTPFMVIQQAS